ncbi:failed axon connections homolog isoform X2 [Littorina saxatilis]|uniref:Failed axon connections-like n=1 Tax=Littorina saxatilis TaxID=31220 RepID=A0AAN9ARH9_9CAEN
METIRTIYSDHPALTTIAGGLVVATAGILVYRRLRRNTTASNAEEDYPKDTVILHQIGRGPFAPSMTPFAIKLETYLRIAKIPYKNVHDMKKSSKGKYPWISFNGHSVADSAFCIEFINKKRNVDLSSWLSPEQRAVALAFQRLAEEDIYWVLVVQRWVQEVSVEFFRMAYSFPLSWLFLRFYVTPSVRRMAFDQGMGRHSKDEVLHIARKDLTALSVFIGTKRFLMGDQPCEEDCAIFGQLSQLYWQLTGPTSNMFKEEFPRLVSYCERMKDRFWPDWVECTTQGGTSKATK